jgi:hypothetical protein
MVPVNELERTLDDLDLLADRKALRSNGCLDLAGLRICLASRRKSGRLYGRGSYETGNR